MRALFILLLGLLSIGCGGPHKFFNNYDQDRTDEVERTGDPTPEVRTPPKNPAPSPVSSSDDEAHFLAFQDGHPENVVGLEAAFSIADDDEGAFVAFYSNQRYFAGVVAKVSAMTYNMQGTVGYYRVVNGQLVVEGKRTTCKRDSQAEPSRIIGTPTSSQLVLYRNDSTVVLPRYFPSSSSSGQGGGLIIRWGCFTADGRFIPESWSKF